MLPQWKEGEGQGEGIYRGMGSTAWWLRKEVLGQTGSSLDPNSAVC